MAELQSEHVLVVAIDFGTTYSGYAFSSGVEFEKDPTKISSNKPWIASQGLVSHKTPTCVLLNPDGTFKNFGYQAEDKYNEIAADDSQDHSQFYFFRRFKMVLHTRAHLNREVTVEDETGKSMKAIDVFAHGIRFLKDHALETINIQGLQIDEMDIHWVITVPAIWSDGAKQFMREAAQKAGVEENNLSIALEPEAASVYCKYLPIHQLGQDASGGCFLPGAKYMVIDLGARTSLGGECCNGYHDLSGEYHGSQWCSDLCCGSSKLGLLNCCNTPILTAPDTDKSTTCGKFFKEPQDIWIPIVIGLGVVVFLAGLGKAIACCCQYCDKRSGTNGVQPQETPTPPSEARTEDFHHKQTPPISHVRTLHVNCYSGSQYSGYLVKYNNAHAQQAWVPLGSEHEKE